MMGLINEESKCTKKEENRYWKTKLHTNLKAMLLTISMSNCNLLKMTS